MRRKFKALKITPAKVGSGVHDVSVNHDRYLAAFTYARKLAGPDATLHAPSPQSHTSMRSPLSGQTARTDSSACASCGTTRYPLKARDMCGRCYNAHRHLDQIDKWDISDEKTLKGYPPGAMYRNRKS